MFLNEKNINEIIGLSVISPLGNTGLEIEVDVLECNCYCHIDGHCVMC